MNKYTWTSHSLYKMQYYKLSESLVKRVIRYPMRVEEGVIENAVACMKPANAKKYSEVWVMYCLVQERGNSKFKTRNSKQINPVSGRELSSVTDSTAKQRTPVINGIKIITAWRYPGRSPERNPVPADILEEAKKIIGV